MDAAIQVQGGDGDQHLGHLPAIGPGVHHHPTPYRAGDAGGKFQPRERSPLGGIGQPGQGHAAPGTQLSVLLPNPVQRVCGVSPGGLDEKALHPLVGHQQVGAVAQEKGQNIRLPGGQHGGLGLDGRLGQGHQPGRAADAKGRVSGHGLVRPHLQPGAPPGQLLL